MTLTVAILLNALVFTTTLIFIGFNFSKETKEYAFRFGTIYFLMQIWMVIYFAYKGLEI